MQLQYCDGCKIRVDEQEAVTVGDHVYCAACAAARAAPPNRSSTGARAPVRASTGMHRPTASRHSPASGVHRPSQAIRRTPPSGSHGVISSPPRRASPRGGAPEVRAATPSAGSHHVGQGATANSSNKMMTWGLAAAGLVLAVLGVVLMTRSRGGSKPKPAEPGGTITKPAESGLTKTPAGTTVSTVPGGGPGPIALNPTGGTEPAKTPPVTPEKTDDPPRKPVSGLFADMGDIREESAKRELDRLIDMETGGKVTVFELRRRYDAFLSGSHKNTKSGQVAAERLKKLPEMTMRPADNSANVQPGLAVKVYEKGPDNAVVGASFSALKLMSDKVAQNIDIPNEGALADQLTGGRRENVVLQFTGFLEVPRDGTYMLYTNSDDGSALYIGDMLVVSNDGDHAMTKKGGEMPMLAGKHRFRVDYYQGNGQGGIIVSWSGPDMGEQTIPASAFSHAP